MKKTLAVLLLLTACSGNIFNNTNTTSTTKYIETEAGLVWCNEFTEKVNRLDTIIKIEAIVEILRNLYDDDARYIISARSQGKPIGYSIKKYKETRTKADSQIMELQALVNSITPPEYVTSFSRYERIANIYLPNGFFYIDNIVLKTGGNPDPSIRQITIAIRNTERAIGHIEASNFSC